MAHFSVTVRRERKRKIALVARYAPALARRVERRELTPERAIRIVVAELIRSENPPWMGRAITLPVSGSLAGDGSLRSDGSLQVAGSLPYCGSLSDIGSFAPGGSLRPAGSLAAFGSLMCSGVDDPVPILILRQCQ